MIKSFDISAPASWQQLTLEQLYMVARLLDANLDRDTLLLVLFCKLSGLKTRHDKDGVVFTDGKTRFRLEPYQLRQFCDSMKFIIDERPANVVNPTRVNGHLIDVKFGSYFYADSMIGRYATEGKTVYVKKALRELGDRRLFITRTEANVTLLWWNGVRGYLKEKYPLVFPDSGCDGEARSPFDTLQDIFLMLNDNRPQDNKMISDSDVHGVLSALNSKIGQYNRMKELYKK